MIRFGKWLALLASVACAVAAAQAEQFWIAWEGDDYPENEGWTRTTYGGGAERSLEEGAIVLDGLASAEISDFYARYPPSEPEDGEVFVLHWGLCVDEVHGFADPAMSVDSSHGYLALWYNETGIYSLFEAVWIDVVPGHFHEYTLTSSDMATYALYIDGALTHVGEFVGPAFPLRVAWGDWTRGARSRSTWDYVRFGVIPEPSAGLLLGSVSLMATLLRVPRTRRISDETA